MIKVKHELVKTVLADPKNELRFVAIFEIFIQLHIIHALWLSLFLVEVLFSLGFSSGDQK